ncbi:HpaII family restriction endonuclease [Flavobacterium tegetincola]|uniref:HpaII family restriction endonuclease n=1 Tax=Flavobacterium tegetincola TaxID=150172 RepID=UPI00041A6666|nr:HpaII family restriction endonuclease [Flavobacterium tegetincola]
MITGNKGEWSEFYVFLKLLADGKIYAADKNLIKNENLFYKILKIIRGNERDYQYLRETEVIILDENDEVISKISIEEINLITKKFYEGITKGSTGERTFNLDFAANVFQQFYTNSLSDERKQTADIRIVIHDPITQHEPLLGFSIKSYIGSKPTLFNASKNSNFIFQVIPSLDNAAKDYVNNLDTYGIRMKWLNDNGYQFKFKRVNGELFQSNLELIDSKMPEIMASLILNSYLTDKNKLEDLVEILEQENPCGFNISTNQNFYKYKIKRILIDAALGMKAGKMWDGTFNANGGYIIVKKDGDIVCFHIYNWNDFQDYLLTHTKIDYPDSKPNRCDFGRILNADELDEKEGSFIKLNFQFRFI